MRKYEIARSQDDRDAAAREFIVTTNHIMKCITQ